LNPTPARSPRGARRFVVAAFSGALLLAGALPAGAERMEVSPPWRVGGRVGFTVDAYAMPDSSGLVLEVALRVPPATVEQLSLDAGGAASLRAEFKVKGRQRGRPLEAVQTFALTPDDSAGGQGKVVVARFPAVPGTCDIEVRLTDVVSRKPGLVLPGASPNYSQAVSGSVVVPAAQAGRELSNIEFLWPAPASPAPLAFVRGGRTAVPNPDRLYGLMVGELRARFVARGKPDSPPRPWHWVARVFDADGHGVAQSESTGTAATELDTDVGFDVTREPAGAYSLEIKAWQEGDAGALQRRAGFSIGWHSDTWLRNAADIADEVHFLLSAGGEEQFGVMPPGAQERLMREFWDRRDPTPETALNESYDTFRARVDHANESFARAGRSKGMFSDMGRVYIRYGEPSEVLRQVIPAGNETLTQQLQEIIDTETRLPDNVHAPGPGGDMRPFEVWVYEGDIPMPLDVDPHDTDRGRLPHRMVFLFVDEQGTGVYRQRYSTE
jgi:GWxTD domain-containing protein